MAAVTRWFFKSAIRRGPRTTLSRVLIGSGVVYSFSEPELPRLENPITFPKLEKLSPDFLIRQACALSAEQANTIATLAVMTMNECVEALTGYILELSNLFDASVATGFALTDEGHHRVVELQEQIRLCKREVSDLEILFHYVKKLLEANCEVAFCTGAEIVSNQTSERLHSMSQHVTKMLEEVRTLERDLVKIQQKHIEIVGKIIKEIEKCD